MKNKVKGAAIVLFWIMLWQLLSLFIKNNIVFASPLMVVTRLGQMAGEAKFWMSVVYSLLRIVLGFTVAFLLGYICGFIGGYSKLFRKVLSPLVVFLKSVPVASIVVLLLICFGSGWLSVYVTFMVVFPNVYINLMEAVDKADKDMLEMADDFKLTYVRKWIYVIGQSAAPLLLGAVRLSVGMSFKSGVAAEVIGICNLSLGELLYRSKIYIDTAGVLAVTLVIVLLSYLCEKSIVYLLDMLIDRSMHCARSLLANQINEPSDISINEVSIGYGDGYIIKDISCQIKKHGLYVITGGSGVGKTTFINYLTGKLEGSHGFLYDKAPCVSMQYQEDRLIGRMSIISNLMLVRSSYNKEDIVNMLYLLLPGVDINKKVEQCSGGMKRRVSLIRALISSGELLVLDEPFAGLDEENRKLAMDAILKHKGSRTLFITAHDTRRGDFGGFEEIAIGS